MSVQDQDRRKTAARMAKRVCRGAELSSVAPFGEGLDHRSYLVDDWLVVRFETDPDPVERARRVAAEAGVLEAASTASPPAVPVPLLVAAQDGALAYAKVPGVPLLGQYAASRRREPVGFAEVMGGFLQQLHGTAMVPAGVPSEQEPLTAWLARAAEDYRHVVAHVPVSMRRTVEAFLGSSPQSAPDEAVLCHNDLGIEHILVDKGEWVVTGVIDWGDAAVTDPAHDLARIYRDLGPGALAGLAAHYDGADKLTVRAQFYARCTVFEDLRYGLDTGREDYLSKSIVSLGWLFPP